MMSGIHDVLIQVAKAGYKNLEKKAQEKRGFVPMLGGEAPPPAPPDPSMMGAMPPMDPSMMGGAPPMDPSMMGGAPPMPVPPMPPGMPMDPSMMGAMGGAPAPIDPSMLEAIRQVVREELGAQAPAAGAAEKPKASGKAAVEERLTKIEGMLQQLLTTLGIPGAGAVPGGAPMPPAAPPGLAMPPVPPGEMGAPVPGMEVAAAEQEPEDRVMKLAGTLAALRSMRQI